MAAGGLAAGATSGGGGVLGGAGTMHVPLMHVSPGPHAGAHSAFV